MKSLFVLLVAVSCHHRPNVQYEVEYSDGCSIESVHVTDLIYRTEKSSGDEMRCKAHFTCKDDHVLVYTLTEYRMYSNSNSYLGL